MHSLQAEVAAVVMWQFAPRERRKVGNCVSCCVLHVFQSVSQWAQFKFSTHNVSFWQRDVLWRKFLLLYTP